MRLSKSLQIGAAVLILFIPTCAHHSVIDFSPESEVFRKIIYSIDNTFSKYRQEEFDRILKAGPYTLEVYLDTFWDRYDPIFETEQNEYQMRFEARLAGGFSKLAPPDSIYPDDRIVALVLYGEPTFQEEFTLPATGDCVGWRYNPDPAIIAAGGDHRLLRNLEFAVTFKKHADGRYTLIPSDNKLWRPPPEHLSHSEVMELENILSNEENDCYLRAAAAWRLRSVPSQRALKALLESAFSEDPIVYTAIAGAIRPLIVTKGAVFDRFGIYLATPDTRQQEPDNIPVMDPAPPDPHVADIEEFTTRARDLYGEIYNPAALYPIRTIASLKAAASAADSFLHSHGWLEPEEADALYVGALETARFLLDSENPIDAHVLLEPLLRESYKDNPEAWHLDALALLESGTPGGRQQSEDRIRKALRLDPGNLRYRLTLAQILDRRTFAYYADDTLDRILEEAPTLAGAYALKARMRFEHYWQIGWRAGGWGHTPLDGRRKSISIRRAEATDMLNMALILDSDNVFATWWLGWHHVIARRWQDVIPVMNYLISEGAHVAEALLARGLAYQHLGHLDLAWMDYEAALSMLKTHVRAMAIDPRWILPPSAGGITLQGKTALTETSGSARAVNQEMGRDPKLEDDSARFWRSKDPLFSSTINERLLEQHRRFAYVTWHFAVPNLGLRGWDSHRGRIYLRYGEPMEYQVIENELRQISSKKDMFEGESESSRDWEYRADLARALNHASIWTYPGLRVSFRVGFVTGNYSVNRPAEFVREVELNPESTRVEGARKVLNMDATWYYFESLDQKIELIPVVNVPVLYVQDMASPSGLQDGCPMTLMILDSNWNPTHHENYLFELYKRGTTVQRYWIGQTVVLPADTPYAAAAYSAVELIPPEPRLAFASRDTLPQWNKSELRLSSLVLAKGIDQFGPELDWLDRTYFIRNNQAVMPRPDGVFSPVEPVYVYTEIYDLKKDEYGATSYQIALSITALDERKGLFTTIVDILGNLIRRESRDGMVTLLFDREGISSHAQEKLRIAFPEGSDTNRFIIRIAVTDLITGENTERSTLLSISR